MHGVLIGTALESYVHPQNESQEMVKSKETSDTNGRVTATGPVNTAVPDLHHEFTQA